MPSRPQTHDTTRIAEFIGRNETRPKILAVSGISHGAFWEELKEGMKEQAKAYDHAIEGIYSKEAHLEETSDLLRRYSDRIDLFIFTSGPVDQNNSLIRAVVQNRKTRVVTSGFSLTLPNVIQYSVDNARIGTMLADRMIDDYGFGKRSSDEVLTIVPSEPINWWPITLRYMAWTKRVRSRCPNLRVAEFEFEANKAVEAANAVRWFVKRIGLKRGPIVTFSSSTATGAVDALEGLARRARKRPRGRRLVYGVDLTREVIASMTAPGTTEFWGAAAGIYLDRYGKGIVAAGIEFLRDKLPSQAPDEPTLLTPAELREADAKELIHVVRWKGWTRSTIDVGERPAPADSDKLPDLSFLDRTYDVENATLHGVDGKPVSLGGRSGPQRSVIALLFLRKGGLVTDVEILGAIEKASPRKVLAESSNATTSVALDSLQSEGVTPSQRRITDCIYRVNQSMQKVQLRAARDATERGYHLSPLSTPTTSALPALESEPRTNESEEQPSRVASTTPGSTRTAPSHRLLNKSSRRRKG